MFNINLLGTTLNLKSEHCTKNNSSEIVPITELYVNMYVRIQNHCNAHCKFCEFRGQKVNFDLEKFGFALLKIHEKFRINKISFTGGEPTLDIPLLTKAIDYVKKIDPKIFTVVNTNGINLPQLIGLDIDSVALSRHHYDDIINDEILGYEAPSKTMINLLSKALKLHLSCNLVKGYIDSEEEVLKYLEFCSNIGITDVGFVSLMKVNDYCTNHHIDFKDFDFTKYNNILRNRTWNNKDSCRCANYLYASPNDDDIVKMYSRYYCKQDNIESQLVFDGTVLKDGFNGKIII